VPPKRAEATAEDVSTPRNAGGSVRAPARLVKVSTDAGARL
jgi:hypothetical protein